MNEPQIVYRDGAMLAATCRNVLLACFVAPSEANHLNTLRTHYQKLAVAFPSGVATLVILPSRLGGEVLRTAPGPSPEVRRLTVEILRSFEKSILGVALVLDEEGVMASVKRASVSALLMMSRNQYTRVFPNLVDASEWLAVRCRKSQEQLWSSAQIRSMSEQFLAQVGPAQGQKVTT